MPTPKTPSFRPLPKDLQIPIDYEEADKLFKTKANPELNEDLPELHHGTVRCLGPHLYIVRNARPQYRAEAKLTTGSTISLVYMGTTCIVYTPSKWAFLNSDGLRHDVLKEIFTKFLAPSATPFLDWTISSHKVDSFGSRGALNNKYAFRDYMAVHPPSGQVLPEPYAPRE